MKTKTRPLVLLSNQRFRSGIQTFLTRHSLELHDTAEQYSVAVEHTGVSQLYHCIDLDTSDPKFLGTVIIDCRQST